MPWESTPEESSNSSPGTRQVDPSPLTQGVSPSHSPASPSQLRDNSAKRARDECSSSSSESREEAKRRRVGPRRPAPPPPPPRTRKRRRSSSSSSSSSDSGRRKKRGRSGRKRGGKSRNRKRRRSSHSDQSKENKEFAGIESYTVVHEWKRNHGERKDQSKEFKRYITSKQYLQDYKGLKLLEARKYARKSLGVLKVEGVEGRGSVEVDEFGRRKVPMPKPPPKPKHHMTPLAEALAILAGPAPPLPTGGLEPILEALAEEPEAGELGEVAETPAATEATDAEAPPTEEAAAATTEEPSPAETAEQPQPPPANPEPAPAPPTAPTETCPNPEADTYTARVLVVVGVPEDIMRDSTSILPYFHGLIQHAGVDRPHPLVEAESHVQAGRSFVLVEFRSVEDTTMCFETWKKMEIAGLAVSRPNDYKTPEGDAETYILDIPDQKGEPSETTVFKLLVTNIPPGATRRLLADYFTKFGEASVYYNAGQDVAVLQYFSAEDSQRVLKQACDFRHILSSLGGAVLGVEPARDYWRRPERPASPAPVEESMKKEESAPGEQVAPTRVVKIRNMVMGATNVMQDEKQYNSLIVAVQRSLFPFGRVRKIHIPRDYLKTDAEVKLLLKTVKELSAAGKYEQACEAQEKANDLTEQREKMESERGAVYVQYDTVEHAEKAKPALHDKTFTAEDLGVSNLCQSYYYEESLFFKMCLKSGNWIVPKQQPSSE